MTQMHTNPHKEPFLLETKKDERASKERCLRYSIQAILMEQIPRKPSKTSNGETKGYKRREVRAIQESISPSRKQTKG